MGKSKKNDLNLSFIKKKQIETQNYEIERHNTMKLTYGFLSSHNS